MIQSMNTVARVSGSLFFVMVLMLAHHARSQDSTNPPIKPLSGDDREEMQPAIVDLSKVAGKEIVIRIVDGKKGPWGHINFDDFAFYADRPKFKNAMKPVESLADLPDRDVYKFAGVAPEKAAE